MDITILTRATEEFASFWSEVTAGDLATPVPGTGIDVGATLVSAIQRCARDTNALTGTVADAGATSGTGTLSRAGLADLADLSGGGYESPYLAATAALRSAFEVADGADPAVQGRYADAVRDTTAAARALAAALDLDLDPDPPGRG